MPVHMTSWTRAERKVCLLCGGSRIIPLPHSSAFVAPVNHHPVSSNPQVTKPSRRPRQHHLASTRRQTTSLLLSWPGPGQGLVLVLRLRLLMPGQAQVKRSFTQHAGFTQRSMQRGWCCVKPRCQLESLIPTKAHSPMHSPCLMDGRV